RADTAQTVPWLNARPYNGATGTSDSTRTHNTIAPASSAEWPRRANIPASNPSTGRMTSGATELASCHLPIDPRAAATSPYQGPKRMATGSVTRRPSINGATAVSATELMMRPATPHTTAMPRRRRTSDFMKGCDGGSTTVPHLCAPFVPPEPIRVDATFVVEIAHQSPQKSKLPANVPIVS